METQAECDWGRGGRERRVLADSHDRCKVNS